MSRRLHILPDGLKWDDISWEPTWEEKALDWHRQQMALALAEVKRIELEEQRLWLEGETRRIALVALEIDETSAGLRYRMRWTAKISGGPTLRSARRHRTKH